VHNITTGLGLFSNYCYSILPDSEGEVWIGHERGFSRYVRDSTGLEIIKVYTTDFARGGNCNPQAIAETSRGEILIGTTAGLIIFNRKADKKVEGSPKNNIMRITVNDESVPINSSYSFRYGTYNIKIDYVGINFNDPEKVFYSSRIDGLNNVWSELTTQRYERFTLNKEGRYRFNLISVNEDRYSQEEPLYIDFIIRKPFWRTWWFILALILTATGVIVLIIYERDKAHKRLNKYLEDELAARTRVVMKQKEELQIQNMEITDSINYAKRIQSSILPDVNKLKESLSDAFIMFLPRDIVCGDFYWFDKISDEKFMLICADSTGHGVPGGFMSMIGSALLQDIILRKGVTRPSEILYTLDRQIFSTLNQNIDIGVSNDGMDMVVCEINPKTRHIRFASAMRPVILVMEGEPYYVKGNRCSVGGEAVIEKYFDDQEYYLNEGDQIYLFSDGLPDQFGGSDGKKMKIIRLKKLIEDISKLPMNDQKEAMLAFFDEWKGEFDQVDDVLFMGVKV
jgi:serine phosphatase RsbU (regulator of sigma subunit)